ncbi:NACHT domain-containing protein [Kitasatospora albolonga]|uniref:NACHT domain-containing protein n=2 Tax=Kitasatospora albolonga TaxID=68173 RepID=UPI0035E9D3EE
MERRRFWWWGRRPGSEVRVDVGGAGAVGVGRDVVHGAIGENATVVHNEITVHVGPPGADAAPTDREVEQALAGYLARVRESQRRLNLDVLGPGDAAGELPQIELRQVFVPQLTRPFETRLPDDLRRLLTEAGELVDGPLPPGLDSTAAQQLSDTQRSVLPRPVLEVLAEGAVSRLVVLGDPGAGKSTLAKYLALALAGALDRLPDELAPLEGCVPLIVELRQYAQERWRERSFEDFLDHVHEQGRMELPRPVLEHILARGRVVMVFDGLDEVFDPEVRAETARRIAAFAISRPGVRIVVTSREYGYRSHEFSSAGFTQVMLQNLERRQVTEFVGLWYTAAHPGEPGQARRLARRLLDSVREVRAVGELAANPLLLTILASIGLGRTIPRERRKVYEHAIEVLIGRWDRDAKFLNAPGPADAEAARAVEWLTTSRRLRLLERIARRMQDSADRPSGTYIRHDELIEIVADYLTGHHIDRTAADIAAHHLVDQLRTRNFLLAHFGGGVYGFVHRTFLEYLTANDILYRRNEEEWSREELLDHLGRHTADPAWHEVILLTVGGLRQRDAAAFIHYLLQRLKGREVREAGLQLALRALAERDDFETAPAPGSPSRHLSLTVQGNAVIDALVLAAFQREFRTTGETDVALRSVSRYWGGRARYLRWYHAVACDTDRDGSDMAGIASLLARDLDELRFQTSVPWDSALREAAIGRLGDQWPDSEDVFTDFLADATDRTRPAGTREGALAALARDWADRDEVFAVMREAAIDSEPGVHRTALYYLAYRWRARPEAFDTVMAAATDERSPGRLLAIGVLALGWTQHEGVFSAVMRAAEEMDPEVRGAAVLALGADYRDRAAAREVLCAAVVDADFSVRRRSMAVFDREWPDPAEAFGAVLAGLRDEHEAVRLAALHTVALHWPDKEASLGAVLDAMADEDREVSRSALHLLGTGWPSSAEAFEAVRAVAADGSSEDQGGALAVLARRWTDRQESFETVLAAATATGAQGRETAVAILAQYWRDREEVLAVALAAADAAEPSVRVEGLVVLANRWPEETSVLPLLLAATTDPHHEVRAIALQLLAVYWPEISEVATLVMNAVADGHPEVRGVAISLLGVWRADDSALRTVAAAGVVDESPRVREAALQVLAAVEPGQYHGLILDHARTDPEAAVRILALRLVASILPQEPGTRELLTELVEDADVAVAAAVREALPLLDLPRQSLLP